MLPVADQAAAGRARPRCELADVFREYGEKYRRDHSLPVSHLRVMRAVERCRTVALGGHMQQCDCCGFERPAYNSCRNRHCPKCQSLAKAKWLEKQKSELLPVGYFHLVFTLPHELNRLILINKKPLINLLFQAVSETLLEFAKTHLQGTLGITAVLHSWNQTLLDHFHLHCLVPAGALSFDQNRWTPARKNFLFHVKALSLVFRGKFLDLLKKAFDREKLCFVGQSAPLADRAAFKLLLKALRQKSWIVYAKKSFGSPVHVLDYLGRYTHRVALSNDRIYSVHNAEVTLRYRDRKNQQLKFVKLQADEFIRRFLLHVIPKGLMRVRHFGFLANRSKSLLSKCRQLLDLNPTLPKLPRESAHELMLALTGIDLTRCPLCQKGTLVFLTNLSIPAPWDSS
jgi:putative transposase/transposase-like zinc-binding protein